MSAFELQQFAPMELRGHRGSVACVLWIASRHQLVTVGDDRSIRIWNVITGKAIKSFCRCFEEDIDSVFHFDMFSHLLFATSGQNLIVLNLDNGVLIDTTPFAILSFSSEISSLTTIAVRSQLVLGDENGSILFHRIELTPEFMQTQQQSITEDAHKSLVSHLLHYERGGKEFLLSSSYDCSCILWKIEDDISQLARLDFANLGEVTGQMFNPPFVNAVIEVDDDFLAAALGDGSIKIFRKQDLFVMDSQEFHNHQTLTIEKVGEECFSAGLDGTMQVFSIQKTLKKDKGKTKTKISLLPRTSFKHPSKINSSAIVSIDDEKRFIAVADIGPVVFLYNYPL